MTVEINVGITGWTQKMNVYWEARTGPTGSQPGDVGILCGGSEWRHAPGMDHWSGSNKGTPKARESRELGN